MNTSPQQEMENYQQAHEAAASSGLPQMDGVELLVHLTKTGKVDPWNLDIVKVADEYLKAVADMKESDLKITGKTLLYLAILLRMKSDQLAGIDYLDPPEEEEFFDDGMDLDMADDGYQPNLPFDSLEDAIQRRTSTKQRRIRQVTLNDLIKELTRYEEMEKRRELKTKIDKSNQRRMRDYSEFTADDIEEMAHEEFIEDTIARLAGILDRILNKNEEVSLSELEHEGGIDKISAFLALLFLAARGEIGLKQEDFYSELFITRDFEDEIIPDRLKEGEELEEDVFEPRKPRKKKTEETDDTSEEITEESSEDEMEEVAEEMTDDDEEDMIEAEMLELSENTELEETDV